MEKMVEELKSLINFKDSTEIGDVVLVLNEGDDENQQIGAVYAVVNDFERDMTKKDEWWHVHFTFLSIPPQPQKIILQPDHFTGKEIFTMGGKKVFIKALDFSGPEKSDIDPEPEEKKGGLRLVK